MSTDTTTAIYAQTFAKLPRGAQLLAAYALINDKWQIQLLQTDRDMMALRTEGWLISEQSPMHCVLNCTFPDNVWVGMESIEKTILDSVSQDELERYVNRKGKEYPWLW